MESKAHIPYHNGVYEFTTGLDYWTGLLDWTTGLIKKMWFYTILRAVRGQGHFKGHQEAQP